MGEPTTTFGVDPLPPTPCPWWSTSLGECRDSALCELPPRCVGGMVQTDAGTLHIMQEMATEEATDD